MNILRKIFGIQEYAMEIVEFKIYFRGGQTLAMMTQHFPSKPSFFKIVGVKLNSINFYIKMLNNEEVYMFKLGPFLI